MEQSPDIAARDVPLPLSSGPLSSSPLSLELFGAFRGRPTPSKTRLWSGVLGGLILAGTVAGILAYSHERITVVTPYGLKTVAPGWTPEQVTRSLGRAVSIEKGQGDLECRRYAQPTVKSETVAVYTICFRGGKLVTVAEQPFGLWKLKKDGTLGPMKEPPPPGPPPDAWRGTAPPTAPSPSEAAPHPAP